LKPPVSTVVVPEVQLVTVEVTRIVRETVVVTPSTPMVWSLRITLGPPLGIPRTWHTATRLTDGRVLLAGGSNGGDEQYAIVDVLDPVSGQIAPAAPLGTPRHEHSATLLPDGRVLVVGGYNAQQQWLADAEIYDPAANTWTRVPPGHAHGVQHTATLLSDGRVLVVGGCTGSGLCTDRVDVFDPLTDSWSEGPPLASVRASHAAVLLEDGRVLVAGGTVDDSDAVVFDPATNAWTATGPMVSRRAQAPMIRLSDGRVLAAGGIRLPGDPVVLASAERFDPTTNAWTPAAPLAEPRYAHSLLQLPDGQVLAVGGAREYDYPAGHPAGSPWMTTSFILPVECYEPLSDRWYSTGALPLPETYAGIALLMDGRFLLSGGGVGHAGASAWEHTLLLEPVPAEP
jgi:hypothetical protein